MLKLTSVCSSRFQIIENLYLFVHIGGGVFLRYMFCFQLQEGLEPSRQRWFFGGKLLGDKLRIEESKIQPGYVVQVIVNSDQQLHLES